MSIRMVVKAANNLPKLDQFGKCDPFCELTFHDEKQSTRVIDNNQNPEWNESFKWTLEVVPDVTEGIRVDVYDHETLGKDRLMARGAVPLAEVLESKGVANLDIRLQSPDDQPLQSTLSVQLEYTVPVSQKLKQQAERNEKEKLTLREQLNAAKLRLEELEEQLQHLSAMAGKNEKELSEKKGVVKILTKLIAGEKEHYEGKLREERLILQDRVQELTSQLERESGGGGSDTAQIHEANTQLHEVEVQQRTLQQIIPGFKGGVATSVTTDIDFDLTGVPLFEEVEDRVLTSDDLPRVRASISDAAPKWHSIGLTFGLRPSTLNIIRAANFEDVEFCLNAVLAHWLNQDYQVSRHGQPTWRKLLMVIAHPVGGNNASLANSIASGRQPKKPPPFPQSLLKPGDESKKECCTIL